MFDRESTAFASFTCVISDISCMSWPRVSIMLTHFLSLKPSLKCIFCHAYKHVTVSELLRWENCSALLLAVTLPALFVFICCSFHILNSFSSYLNCYLCEVDLYSHLFCSLGPLRRLSLVGCRDLHVFTASLCELK